MVYLRKKIIISAIAFLVILGALFAYKAGRTITVIGTGEDDSWEETASLSPPLPTPEEHRIDILLIGIRGYDGSKEWSNGEWLADTIILASFNTLNNKAAVISIPRDLYVDIPKHGKDKINAVYAVGETRNFGGGGLQLLKAVVSYTAGVYVDHAISVDFNGFKKIIDHLGGITIYRQTEFTESKQWLQDGRTEKRYWRLAQNTSSTEALGWEFYVPRGMNTMNSEEALYYARSRYSSSDFDRMHRQQEVVDAVKSKALNLGVLANPVKIFNILDTIQNNVRTDMSISEMKDLLALAQKKKIQNFKKAVLDTSEGGLLIEDKINGLYVLLPKAKNFSEIQELAKNIVN